MKKIMSTLMCCCLAVCLAFLATGCDGTTDDGGSDDPGGVGNVMQGGERPNYDEMFDFESGYTPPDPRDPNKMVTLRMDERSPVTFAGGERSVSVKYNTVLSAEDFELTGVAEGRELQGLSDLNAKGEYNFARDLETFRVPYDDTTILPYFSAPVGYEQLNVGSTRTFNFDSIKSGSFKKNGTIKHSANVIVAGGEGSYPELGVAITETSRIEFDSAFRTDTAYPVTGDTVYAFKYNFENMGTETIHLNAYQINGSGEHTSSYKNRYRINIDLEPGESMSADYQFKPGGNGNNNALTYVVSNDDMDNMILGMSMSAAVTELKEPETVNPTTEYTLTLGGEGVTFADGTKAVQLLERDTLPAVTNNNGYADIIGWYDVNDPSNVWNNSSFELRDKKDNAAGSAPVPRFTMPAENMTIAPLLSKRETRALIPASAALECTDGVSCERAGTKIFNTVADNGIAASVGAEFAYRGKAGGSFTLATSCASAIGSDSALKNTEHTFDYIFKNTGSETVTFAAYQVNADAVRIDGASTGEITLAAGESRAVSVAAALYASADAYTVIELGKDQADAKLGIVTAKNSYDKFELTIGGEDVSFEGGGSIAYVGDGMPLPSVVNNKTDADIAGWYNVDEPGSFWRHAETMLRDKNPSGTTGKEVTRFAMPGQNTTIAPFFVAKGQRPLIPASGNGIDNASKDMAVKRETKLFETEIGTQLGAELSFAGSKYDGPAVGNAGSATTGRFRVVSSAAEKNTLTGALKAGDHTFDFWFKNTGEETVEFTAYQVISMSNLLAGKNTGAITLAPGETWTGSITVTLAGANNNAMTFITLGRDQAAAKLAMVLSKSTANEIA